MTDQSPTLIARADMTPDEIEALRARFLEAQKHGQIQVLPESPPASLAEALAALQAKLPHIGKDKTAKVQTKDNRNYTYDYANLASILTALKSLMGPLGLAFTAKPTTVFRDNGDREFVLEYKLIHAPSGESDAGEWPLPDPLRTTPQQVGSAITYARRYCLCAVLGIAPDDDDDDGQAAATAGPVTGRQPRGKPPLRAAAALPRNRDGTVSRSQATEEELADSGNMTGAQAKEHGKLERETLAGSKAAQRLTATPDDDPWLDSPPGQLPVPQPARPKAGVIHAHFKRLGFDDATPGDKESRLGAMSAITGRRITSTNDLTAVEGIEVGKFLEKCRDRDALIERLAVKAGEPSDA